MSADGVLDWAIQTGITVSILVACILFIRRAVARRFGASAAYALWLLPLIRLFMPPMTLPSILTDWIVTPPEPLVQSVPIQAVPFDALLGPIAASPAQSHLDMSSVIIAIWLIIAAVWFGYQILNHLYQIRLLRLKTRPVSAELRPAIEAAMAKLPIKTCPEIRMSPDGLGPMVTRFWRPMIILPQDFTQKYNAAQQNFALIHEMAHIKRFDLWAAFSVLVFRALNWPNPLIHYAAHKFRIDQEAACDAYLLSRLGEDKTTKQDYARTLVQAAKQSPKHAINAPLGLAFTQSVNDDIEISKGEKRETI